MGAATGVGRTTLMIVAGMVAGTLAASCTSINASFDDPADTDGPSATAGADSGETNSSDSDSDASAGTAATTPGDGGGSTAGDPPERCGNGELDDEEVCDDGHNDGRYGGCNPGCASRAARCGDAETDPGEEECDDGVNDGSYGGCNPGCTSRPAHCGDGLVQADAGEECDDGDLDPTNGCIKNCTIPRSCREIRDGTDADESGIYKIFIMGRAKVVLPVYCDMVSDGGGYTFLKLETQSDVPAPTAETQCDAYGMQLWIPRSPAHLASGWAVANDPVIGLGASADYVSIMGIYPAFEEAGCASQPLHSDNPGCDWEASDGQRFWVDDQDGIPEPDGSGQIDGSMAYQWTNGGELIGYEDFGDGGGTSDRFMCDIGDKF